MTSFDPSNHPHRRLNPLTDEWVLVSPQRANRPWQGQLEPPLADTVPGYDADCYLCPGNKRVNGAVNDDYRGTYVFDNDFSALQTGTPFNESSDPLFQFHSVNGVSRVICFSESHNLGLSRLPQQALEAVVDVWCAQYEELSDQYCWVQIFENKGAANGCSNPHPHGQLWAGDRLPTQVALEGAKQRDYLRGHGSSMLADYATREIAAASRTVCINDDWLVVVPYWATWPFETLLLPRRQVARMPELVESERRSLAAILRALNIRYDNLFETPFPYSMGWHGAPSNEGAMAHWQLHAHFYPPLLRSASVKKFMVGYEMLAEPQRDITPEQAAQKLREQPTVHYLDASRGSNK
jgi:UDPglucose--hexose-1-phosphate uridylyltransferase